MPVESFVRDKNPYDVKKTNNGRGAAAGEVAVFWYPTLLLNLEFKKALPEAGVDWLFVRVDSKQIRNGRMDLEVVILDEAGDIVALSHHVALVMGSERNVAQRKNGNTKL